jgi:tRNA pseudouridine38-40 synthase
MFTYQILIEYDGTNFVGWQRQKNGNSIQGSIEKVLKKLLKQKVILHGSGRTDSGVHANEQSSTLQF